MRPLRFPSRHGAAALIALVAAAAACDDAPPLQPEVASRLAAAPDIEVTNPDSSWDRYSADVAITIDADPAPDSLGILPRTYRMHIERALQSDGRWSTTATFPRAAGAPLGSVAQARITASGLALTDHAGRTMPPLAAPAMLGLLPAGIVAEVPPERRRPDEATSDTTAAPASTGAGRPARSAPPPAASGRGWSDQLVVTQRSRDRLLDGVRARLGGRAGTVRGLGRYVRIDRSGRVAEMLVDEARGLIVEENVLHDGQLRAHVRHAYRVSPGRIERAASRMQLGAKSGRHPRRGMAMEVRYDNVRLSRQGGR